MPYSATTWTDNVTDLSATNMNHLETGVSNAATTADAAIPAPIGPATNAGLVWNGSSWVSALLVNANIDATAAIAYSKLSLAGGIVNNDVSTSAAIAYSKLNLGTSIVNADIASAAAIASSKLALDHGCKAVISSSVSITNGALTTITFDGSEAYDTDSFHDTVTNNSRMTVPTGLGGKYVVAVAIELTAGAISNPGGRFLVNGTTGAGEVSGISTFSGGAGVICGSQIVSLIAGDYIEFQAWMQTGSISANGGWFSIQKVG